ncbi:hypothetical protein K1719_046616 [Acacia pycnantha]|nr:hypothetical protein K1719_046616 [Acacia pycnantha]
MLSSPPSSRFILIIRKLSNSRKRNKNLPPGPPKLPIIGNLHQLFSSPLPFPQTKHTLRNLANKYGPLMCLQLGQLPYMIVSSPEIAKEVMRTHDRTFANRPKILATEICAYNNSDVAFSPYGNYWRQLRKICCVMNLSKKISLGHKFHSRKSSLWEEDQEYRRVYGGKGYIDESELSESKYVAAVIKETLRMHPHAPLLVPRENSERCEIKGYEIPAKSRVIVNAWAIGRDPKYWNEPKNLLPERFLNTTLDYNFKGSNSEFIPFGAGRRICPGVAFATPVVELLISIMLFHFDWKLLNQMKPEELDVEESFGATMKRKNHMCVVPFKYSP